MNDHQTIDRLENALRGQEPERLDVVTLAAIRQHGAQQRTKRRTLAGLATVAGAGVLVAALAVVPGLGDDGAGRDPGRAEDPPLAARPTELTPLQERILREVPGAEQISEWQVALPEPGVPQEMSTLLGEGEFEVDGATIPTGANTYAGVTAYPKSAWPGWLYDEVQRIEKEELGSDDGSYPVGSTDMGVQVLSGRAELACVSFEGGKCGPALVRRSGGELFYEWGFGTDEFLKPGTGMEVFAGNPGASDAPDLVIAGLPGTEVTRVEFVNTAGVVTDGQVTHSLVDGASIMWAAVPGALQRVVAYDADGEVVDDHPLRACSGGVDCEVR